MYIQFNVLYGVFNRQIVRLKAVYPTAEVEDPAVLSNVLSMCRV